MNSELKIISEFDLHQISGGHFSTWSILEIPHMIMGIREFTNYVGERWNHGCAYDENDYFTAFFCNAYSAFRNLF